MNNSTLHRSNLSKENMAVLTELKAYRTNNSQRARSYKKPTQQKELDMLWQTFKINQKEEKSPGIYLLTGFIAGALCMFLMTAVLSMSATNPASDSDIKVETPKAEKKLIRKHKASRISFVPADKPVKTAAPTSESYTVKEGDTLAGIIIRFYGSYDTSKIEKIRVANGMKNPNNISIGQKLIIPLN